MQFNIDKYDFIRGSLHGVNIQLGTIREILIEKVMLDSNKFSKVEREVALPTNHGGTKNTWKADIIAEIDNTVYIIDSKPGFSKSINNNIPLEELSLKCESAFNLYKEANPEKNVIFIFCGALPIVEGDKKIIEHYESKGMQVLQTDDMLKRIAGMDYDIVSETQKDMVSLVTKNLNKWNSGKHESVGRTLPKQSEDFVKGVLALLLD